MDVRHLAFVIVILITVHQQANGELLVYEGFDYDIEELHGQDGGFGWSVGWERTSTGAAQVDGQYTATFSVSQDGVSLDSPIFPISPSGGNLTVAGAGGGGGNNTRVDRYFTGANHFSLAEDGVLYASFLFKKNTVDTSGGPVTQNNMEFDFISEAGGQLVRFGSTSDNQWFVNIADNAFGEVVLGQTYFLVLRVEAHAFSDVVRSVMIFDPSRSVPDEEPETWDFFNSFSSESTIAGARLWIGRQASGQFDEIRIGTTWESVTVNEVVFPEPPGGDLDGDGIVDGHDFLFWQRGFGTTFSAEDLTAWESGFGNGGALSAIPEPTSAVLLVCAVTVMLGRRSQMFG